MEKFESKNGPNYRRIGMEDGHDRALIAPHVMDDENLGRRIVYPAFALNYSLLTGEYSPALPAIRMDYAAGPTSLLFIPAPNELRALGEMFIAEARRIEDEAAALADAVLRKGRP